MEDPNESGSIEDLYEQNKDYIEERARATSSAYPSLLSEIDIINAKSALLSLLKVERDIDIVHLSRADIQRATRFDSAQITEFLMHVSFSLCANITFYTGLELSKEESQKVRLSFGCPIIDACWGGGLLPNGITEVVGESGSGKTQICLQLCLQVQLPLAEGGLGGSAFYISSEGDFPMKRLAQMVESFKRKHASMENVDLTSRIFIERVPTIDALFHLLENRLPQFLQRNNVKLVVIDSIAALFRFEYSGDEAIQRSKVLWRNANQLKLLSDCFSISMLVVNQVSDLFNDAPILGAFTTSHSKVIPALGLTWSNCVNTRIMIGRTKKMIAPPPWMGGSSKKPDPKKRKISENDNNNPKSNNNNSKPMEVVVRKMHIILASHLPNSSCSFIVERDGVRGILE